MAIRVSAIVAMSENNCIGKNNDLPWHIPEDLKRFKAVTMGKPIIMGRKTFESIVARLGRSLPGRANIVVSRSDFKAEGAIVCPDIETAIAQAKNLAEDQELDEVFIGGGAQIYGIALPYTDRIYLTKVHIDVDGDTFFPDLEKNWKEIANENFSGNPPFSIKTLERV